MELILSIRWSSSSEACAICEIRATVNDYLIAPFIADLFISQDLNKFNINQPVPDNRLN